jgi:mevalonate kinase
VPSKLTFQANGKVLLSGEYLVLDGAVALGIPLVLGQRMMVAEGSGSEIIWQSHRPDGQVWFSGKFDLFGFDPIKSNDPEIARRLKEIFEAAVRLNSDFLSKWRKYHVNTYLDFNPEWGLGSSSTLISCISDWADVDPYDLMELTFGGSGYDVACAKARGAIFYQISDDEICVDPADFNPAFSEQLYLIYLGNKQNSRNQMAVYADKKISGSRIDEVSQISKSFCEVSDLKYFDELISDHEKLVSEVIGIPPVKQTMFGEFWGQVKSLGAWGGDFIMVTSDRSAEETQSFFNQKGFDVFFRYDDLVLSESTVSHSNP